MMDKERLRIALLCHPTVGGSGILATELGHKLAERGHEVYLISERPPFRFKQSHPNVHFCESTPVEFPLFTSPDHTLPLATRIASVCHDWEIDVVHAHYAIPHTAAAWIAAKLIGEAAPPIMTTLHGTDIVYLGAMDEYRPLLQHVLETTDRVTCVSRNLKERALSLFELNKEIQVIPNFYEPKPCSKSRIEIRASLGIGDEPLAIHASNLRSIKRIDLLLDAFAGSLASQETKLLVLAGADSKRILPEIAKRQLEDRVVILDDVYEVDNYFAAADFTVYTSEYESFCLGILEGMRHGLPSVSWAVGGIPEVVVDQETGLLLPFGDVDGMSRAIDRLAGDAALRMRLGAKAEKRAAKEFSAERVVGQYEAAYRALLEERGCG